MISEKERKCVLNEFNDTAVDYEKEKTITQLWEEQVRKRGSAVAAVYQEEQLSYGELNQRSNLVAEKLRQMGVSRGDYVALFTQKSLYMLVAILGTIKAGAAYIPIDLNYPKERIDYMLKDSQPKAVITYGTDWKGNCPCLTLEQMEWTKKVDNPVLVNRPEDVLYVIYTSGTTGKPKGVMVTHRNVNAYVCAFTKEYQIDESNVFLQQATYSFDIFTEEVFPTLLTGGSIAIVPEEMKLDMTVLQQYIRKCGVTMISCSPLFLNEFTEKTDTVQVYISGGDVLRKDYFKQLKGAKIYNTYGPTETTVCATYCRCDEHPEDITIGKPIANTQIYIMKGDELCGIGESGELCIAGDGVSKGYLNQPELTAAKFTKNPFGEGKLYHTGDLAKWREDGNIIFQGRMDAQVKIRGFRIELAEVEGAIRKCTDVKDCAVTVVSGENGEKAICAYVVPEKETGEFIPHIQQQLEQRLPYYMRPSYMMTVPKIPMNLNGKLDREALPDISQAVQSGTEYVAPETEFERVLCDIYKEVLQLERIGVKDRFYSLGGDSIKAIRIGTRMKEMHIPVTVRDILNDLSIKQLANRYEQEWKNSREKEESEKRHCVKKRKEGEKLELPVVLQQKVKTYLHRSLPLCILMSYDNYKNWYMSNYIQIFASEEKGYVLMNYLEPRDSFIDVADVVCLGFHMFRKEDDFLEFIKDKLSRGYYIIANLDERELKHTGSYQKEHYVHSRLLYGYDEERQVVKGIGFDDSWIFNWVENDFLEVQKAYIGALQYYKESAPWCEWSGIQLIKPRTPEKQFPFSIKRFVKELHDYVYSCEDAYRLYSFNLNSEKVVYGINTYDLVIEKLNYMLKGEVHIDYRAIHLLYEQICGLHEKIAYIFGELYKNEEILQKNDKLQEMIQELNRIRIQWFAIDYREYENLEEHKAVFQEIIETLQVIKKQQKQVLSDIYQIASQQLPAFAK